MSVENSFGNPRTDYKLDIPIVVLEDLIAQSPVLSRNKDRSFSGALINAYYRELARRATPVGEKRVVYYPGIGGGNEPLDPRSAFLVLDADEVIGVDLKTSANPADTRVDLALQRELEKGYIDEIISASEDSGVFVYDGKRRKLTVYQGDAETFVPNPLPKLTYQRNEPSLLPKVPSQVIASANLIFCSDTGEIPFTVRQLAVNHNFLSLDVLHAIRTLDRGRDQLRLYAVSGRQMLVSRKMLQPKS